MIIFFFSQIFEYEYTQIVDKSFESLFGFTSGMTGSYSCFKFDAIRKTSEPFEYLDNVFQRMVLDDDFVLSKNYNFKIGNMALAEDQMLSYEVLTRKNSHYLTKFLPVKKKKFLEYFFIKIF